MSLYGIIYTTKMMFKSHWNELRSFNFTFSNPLFWIFVIILFMIVTRFWQTKKAFSFCLLVSAVFLLTTKLEVVFKNWLISSGEAFDPLAIRMVAFFVLLMLFFYYTLIRD